MMYMEVKESSEHVVDLAGARSQSRAFSNGQSWLEESGSSTYDQLLNICGAPHGPRDTALETPQSLYCRRRIPETNSI